MSFWFRYILLLVWLLLSGCASLETPEFQEPAVPEKKTWRAAGGEAAPAEVKIEKTWWRRFGDPELDRLVDRAVDENVDLKILVARVGVAESIAGQAKAAGKPSAGASITAGTSGGRGVTPATQFGATTAINWEIDIWGKLREGTLAREAEVRASRADWRAGYLSLVSDVATAYFQILKLDEQAMHQQRALDNAREMLRIYEDLLAEGIIPSTQVLQQKAEINGIKRGLLELERLRKVTENSLATLLGVPAGDLQIPVGRLTERIKEVPVPANLPSTLLSRRPDIIAARYRVLKAHHLTNEARLAKLPSFSLTGRAGVSGFSVSDLLRNFTAGFLPTLNIPILDPAVHARQRVAGAEAKVARETYRKVVLAAFEEVENALVNLDSRYRQRKELENQLQRLQVVAGQVREKQREGMVSQLEVFEAERSLLAAQLALLDNKQQLLADTVRLYKALGGGWGEEALAEGAGMSGEL